MFTTDKSELAVAVICAAVVWIGCSRPVTENRALCGRVARVVQNAVDRSIGTGPFGRCPAVAAPRLRDRMRHECAKKWAALAATVLWIGVTVIGADEVVPEFESTMQGLVETAATNDILELRKSFSNAPAQSSSSRRVGRVRDELPGSSVR